MQKKTNKISVMLLLYTYYCLLFLPCNTTTVIHPCSVLFGNLCVDSGLVPSLLVKKTRVGELRT